MRRMIIALFLIVFAGPATAHGLRLFARVEGQAVSGYAFFVGGGRPSGIAWSARIGEKALAAGQTDEQGAFAFTVPEPVAAAVTISIDTGDGHVAALALAPARFGGAAAASAPAAPASGASAEEAGTPDIEAAIARQVAPLFERIEAMDSRLRMTDILSGLFLIIGLAGMALWARSKRR